MPKNEASFENLIKRISSCKTCAGQIPLPPHPLLQVHPRARILIIGQAPGLKTQKAGRCWSDASGVRLRQWMGISEAEFYNPELVAIVPMGFCYPGKAKSGDLPPRKECAPLWHSSLLSFLKNLDLVLLVGGYAQNYFFTDDFAQNFAPLIDSKKGSDVSDLKKSTLTEIVKQYTRFLPHFFPLPHPSPLNNLWLAKNPWFASGVLPALKRRVEKAVGGSSCLDSHETKINPREKKQSGKDQRIERRGHHHRYQSDD